MERPQHSAIPMLICSEYRRCRYGSKRWEAGKAVRHSKGGSKIRGVEEGSPDSKGLPDRDAMARAYECMVHPEFYKQIGTDIPGAIAKGKEVVSCLYGA